MTEFSELEVARWFWAMAQTAALSFAEATLRPVLMRFSVVARDAWVAVRFCSATIAPTLVLTENVMELPFRRSSAVILTTVSVLLGPVGSKHRAISAANGDALSYWIYAVIGLLST